MMVLSLSSKLMPLNYGKLEQHKIKQTKVHDMVSYCNGKESNIYDLPPAWSDSSHFWPL